MSSISSTSTGAEAHFWAFNVADAAITIGAILVLFEMIGFGRRHASHPV
jgi:lipoprotein signal peptidase